MELKTLQDVLDRGGEVTEYDVQVKRDRLGDMDSIRKEIEKKIPGVEAFNPGILSRDNMWMKAFREFAWSISLVAVLVALIVL